MTKTNFPILQQVNILKQKRKENLQNKRQKTGQHPVFLMIVIAGVNKMLRIFSYNLFCYRKFF